ncbi:MAG: HPF/RaiA family ribosome-associated protein [Polyangiaceae bacterium]
MNVEIRGRHLKLTRSFREYVEHRIGFALDRFVDRIRGVTVQVTDVNGPKGGVDKECRVLVTLRDSGTLVVSDVGPDFGVALDRAAGRAKRKMSRHVDSHARPPHGAEHGHTFAFG